MKIFNRLIIFLAIAFTVINAVLAFTGQTDIQIYLILNILAFLIITLLYVYLNPRARGALTTVSAVFFGIFLLFVALKMMQVLGIHILQAK